MFDGLREGSFDSLALQPYLDDFTLNFKSNIESVNKLERGQSFKEQGFASWEAFASGDWEGALSLARQRREAYIQYFEGKIVHRRLRVVEFPVTPYVQWEMQVLRLRVELGEQIRVLDACLIEDIESEFLLPEIVILGNKVMYQVFYKDGVAAGANRFTDAALIEKSLEDFDVFYARGEEFSDFFDREISPLPPPTV
jgi:hypothetical protein